MTPDNRIEPIPACLALDAGTEVERICGWLRARVYGWRRRGAVVGLSGGIDSSVCAALCARAFGPERVIGLMMPDRDSSPESLELAQLLARQLGINGIVEPVTGILEAAGCYRRRDDAIRSVIPEHRDGDRSKIVLAGVTESAYNIFSVVTESAADGARRRARLTGEAYRAIVAATNFKQRVRKMMEYHHADRCQYAVIGTPNRLEYDQGFFVKLGDGAADLKPIAHLYKTQVYGLAEQLEVPEAIRRRPPTTDTYSLAQSQEEFYFAVPYRTLDVCLHGLNHHTPPEEVALALDLPVSLVERVYRDIDTKRSVTRYLHEPPALVEHVLSEAQPPAHAALTGISR